MSSWRISLAALLTTACAGGAATDAGAGAASGAASGAGGASAGGKAGATNSAGAGGMSANGGAGAGKGGSAGMGVGPGAGGGSGSAGKGGSAGAPPGGTCAQCAATTECATGNVCAELAMAADAFCLPACPSGGCTMGSICMPVATSEGDQVDACVPVTDCGGGAGGSAGAGGTASVGAGGLGPGAGGTGPGAGGTGPGAGGTTGSQKCGALIGPDAGAQCTSCMTSGKTCQKNGCYGGWWCNDNTTKCQAPPNPATCGGVGGKGGTSAGTGGSGTAGTSSGTGGGPSGSVGPDGGTVSVLRFAIVGDTRPPVDNDTKGYPTTVISQIWADIQARSPRPDFAVTTGDYMFASPNSGQAGPQLDLYLKARSVFSGVQFPAFGNHECTGATTSNCGPAGTDGITDNYSQFLSKMLGPIAKKSPYYAVNINGNAGWTAKFVFVAANAWDSTQASWLDQTLSKPTTYTFVVRHESDGVSGVTGVTASKQIIDTYPYTIKLVGHAHTYQRVPSSHEVIIGNGGAPLASSINYGYVIAEQRSDGAIVFTAYDYSTNAQIDQFAVDASGNPA